MRRSRRGQVLFLEFMITLPIFALLIVAMTAFHIHYMNTGQQHGIARNAAWVKSQDIISRKVALPTFKQERAQYVDDLQAGSPIAINAPIGTQFDLAVATKEYRSQSWLGTGEAVGRVEVTQDPWAHEEIQVKGIRLLRENQPFAMPQIEPRYDSGRGGKEDIRQAYMKAQFEFIGNAPAPIGRPFSVDSSAKLLYHKSFTDQQEKGMLSL